MRPAALLGLLACTGCNQFWDLQHADLVELDAHLNLPRIELTSQIALTLPTGGFDPVLVYVPLDPAPTIEIGPVDPGDGALAPAAYEPDGTVQIPIDLFARDPWRLVYTLDGVTREVHWSPSASGLGHFVEPAFGRVDRRPVPAGGGYTITPPNLAANFQHTLTRVFTTGLWTEGEFVLVPPGRTLEYDFGTKAMSQSGPLGAPENAEGDLGVLADFRIDGTAPNQCRVASGVAAFQVPDMVEGSRTPPATQPMYRMGSQGVRLTVPGNPYDRLRSALGGRSNVAPDAFRWRLGYTPSIAAFGFAKPGHDVTGVFMSPGPQIISLVECRFLQGNERLEPDELYADPGELLDRFPKIVHAELVDTRTVNGHLLRSGYSTVVSGTEEVFAVTFGAAAPIAIELRRGGTKLASLSDDPDGATIPAGDAPLVLAFDLEGGGSLGADYFDITLYAVDVQLSRARLYTVAKRELTIDPSVLQSGTEYVFEIRSVRGRPDAVRGDFTTNSYPQHTATVFTRTFKMP